MALDNKDKRKLKTSRKINIEFDEDQKQVHKDFHTYDINFVIGNAGSGKTQVATAIAYKAFCEKQYNRIIIARPLVKNNMGYLPGDKDEKMRPWIAPIIHCLEKVSSKAEVEKMLEMGTLEILPIDYMKGITYTDAVVIIDEFQDMNYDDFELTITRLGKGSKLIYTGSFQQIHYSMKLTTCADRVSRMEKSTGIVGYNVLKSNHRNPAIFEVLEYIDKN